MKLKARHWIAMSLMLVAGLVCAVAGADIGDVLNKVQKGTGIWCELNGYVRQTTMAISIAVVAPACIGLGIGFGALIFRKKG